MALRIAASGAEPGIGKLCGMGRRFGAGGLRVTAGLLALSGVTSAQPSDVLSPIYQAVVRRYASGDREGAVAELSSWPDSRIRGEVPILNRDWERSLFLGDAMNPDVWREIPVKAALMLHTDCALRARREGRSSKLHEAAAWSIAHTLKDHPTYRSFARRWYETYAELALDDYRQGQALDWAERGLADFPDSAELHLVVGSIDELQAVQAAQGAPPALRSELLPRQEIQQHLEAARQALRAAIATDPSLAEAHLRLGRVAWRLGEAAEARAALQAALARSTGGRTAFLAHLFAGRVDEDAGLLHEAASSYEAAVAIDSRAQSARLALSHARLRLGESAVARREVEETLRSADHRQEMDPFWRYPWGPAVGVEDRLEALRLEAAIP
jgi:tetratricopeptide (TPR) repeat protein